jgi:hypothetical protein
VAEEDDKSVESGERLQVTGSEVHDVKDRSCSAKNI